MPPTSDKTPGVDPFTPGDTGPSTQPGDPDEPERIATPNGDPVDTPAYAARTDFGEDFSEDETRARFLEHGDRADLLALIDFYRR